MSFCIHAHFIGSDLDSTALRTADELRTVSPAHKHIFHNQKQCAIIMQEGEASATSTPPTSWENDIHPRRYLKSQPV